jgi:hypothetical protein
MVRSTFPRAVRRDATIFNSALVIAALGKQRCFISLIASESISASGIVGPDILATHRALALRLCVQWRGRRGCVRDAPDAENIQANATQRQKPLRETWRLLRVATPQKRHAIRTVGAEHVGIGLDLAAGHYPCVPINAAGYPALIEALRGSPTSTTFTRSPERTGFASSTPFCDN